MDKPNDGGPAFPSQNFSKESTGNFTEHSFLPGMSVRAYMATQFVAGMLANDSVLGVIHDETNTAEEGCHALALMAIAHADALLKALETN